MMIVWLSDPLALETELVGAKARRLAELAAAALPVPQGFVVTTAAYLKVSTAGYLSGTAPELAPGVAGARMPERVRRAISSAYRQLISSSGPNVAVRSSANAEDLPHVSFAGQHDTFLNVAGEVELLTAVNRCWTSLHSTRAENYRLQRGHIETPSMAVAVQAMIVPEVAGVLFGMHPVTGDANRIVIEATWGIGEAVVAGRVTPDRYVLSKRTGETIEACVADKATRSECRPYGIGYGAVPVAQRTLPCLTMVQRERLLELAIRVEKQFGTPQDVEWAIDRDDICWLLQTRPITTARTAAPQPLPSSVPQYHRLYRRLISGNHLKG